MADASRVEISYRFAGAINLANTLPALVNTDSPTIYGSSLLNSGGWTGFPVLRSATVPGGGDVLGVILIPPKTNTIPLIFSDHNTVITVPPDQVAIDDMGVSLHPFLPSVIPINPALTVFYMKLKTQPSVVSVMIDLLVF